MQSVQPVGQQANSAITWVSWDRVLVSVGGKRIVVKPALAVLVIGILAAIVTIPILMQAGAAKVPEYGLVHPKRWKFAAKPDAVAHITCNQKDTAPEVMPGGKGVSLIDCDAGFTVVVEKPGASGTDSVHMRNSLNLDMLPDPRPITLNFEAQVENGGKKFPIFVTVRDEKTLLWSTQANVEGPWKPYSFATPLKPSKNKSIVLAIHLGNQKGAVSLRNIRMAPQ